MSDKKPTTADLVAALTSLQGLIGHAMGANGDRNPNRAAELNDYLDRAHQLCIDVRSHFPINTGRRSRFADLDTQSKAR